MQLLPSSSSTSSSSQTSGEHGHCEQKLGMGKFERTHLHSLSPPPSPPHLDGKRHPHHRRHSALPPHHHHHHHHPVSKHRQHSPPPLGYFHGQLQLKPSKPSKQVHKLHHKLMKVCKLPKGSGVHHQYQYHAPGASFFGAEAVFGHPPGCCLHYHGTSVEDERLAEEPPHKMGVGNHAHVRRLGAHPHHRPPHKRHPHSHHPGMRCGTVAPMLPGRHVVGAAPPFEASVPQPRPTTMQLADEAAPATLAPY